MGALWSLVGHDVNIYFVLTPLSRERMMLVEMPAFKIFQNWKTSSAGVTVITVQVIHLAFQVKAGTADEHAWTDTAIAVIAGIGLISAGDASVSLTKDEGLTKTEGETTFLKKSDVLPQPPPTAQKQ